VHRFFLLVLSWDFPGGRAYSISPRIGRTYPGPPPEVEGLVITKQLIEGTWPIFDLGEVRLKGIDKPLRIYSLRNGKPLARESLGALRFQQ
jgi:hypothetical protein